MKLLRTHRSWLASLLIVSATLLVGCSKEPPKVGPPPPIPHEDADDIVQALATTMSADNGGWYFTVKAFCESLSVPPPIITVVAGGPGWSVPLGARYGTQTDYSLTRAGITYQFQTGYIRGDGSVTALRDTASQELAAHVLGLGTFAAANGITGNYGFITYQVNSPNDSTYSITGLQSDTLEFSGIADDSLYGVVHSTITPNNGRNWYHLNTVDWNLRIPKSELLTAPYPRGIDSEVNWIIEAMGLNANGDRDAFSFDDIIEARMVFDGSPDAVLTLANVTIDPDWAYYYKVNLNTGKIERLN
jgi:hypothetical protein